MSKPAPVNILLVFANPYQTEALRLGSEDRAIREAIQLSRHRDVLHVTTRFATTIHDLRRALLNETFQIVQISGHGSKQGLLLEDESGGIRVVPQRALAKLFQAYPAIECVLLNACYSMSQGELISQAVPFTIAMEGTLNDAAAIEFSRGFYDALGAKRPIESAYQQGCLSIELALHTVSKLPQLMKRGEREQVRAESLPDAQTPEPLDDLRLQDIQALVGIAIDLSGSMLQSIQNNAGEEMSRLESVRRALEDMTKNAQKSTRASKATGNRQGNIDIFVYGFGLRTAGLHVCDLLSLIKASRQVITPNVIEAAKEQYQLEKQEQYHSYQGLGNLARSLGLSNTVAMFSKAAKHLAQNEIRKRIWRQVSGRVEERVHKIGDTTVSLEELAELWSDSGDMLDNAEELLFGDTPITDALSSITTRLEREMQERSKETHYVLLLISDGKYLDAEPLVLAKRLCSLGVTILSCFVTNTDSTHPRELFSEPQPVWETGAKLMFDMASPLESGSELEHFLLHEGWTLHHQAKMFVQVNHSSVLKEFVRVTLGQFEEPSVMNSLPRGW